jgi:hypothetical protein
MINSRIFTGILVLMNAFLVPSTLSCRQLAATYFDLTGMYQAVDIEDGSIVTITLIRSDEGNDRYHFGMGDSSWTSCPETSQGYASGDGKLKGNVLTVNEVELDCFGGENLVIGPIPFTILSEGIFDSGGSIFHMISANQNNNFDC